MHARPDFLIRPPSHGISPNADRRDGGSRGDRRARRGDRPWVSALSHSSGRCYAPAQLPADVRPFNKKNLDIPINYDAALQGQIRDLILYVSSDQGLHWNQTGLAQPDRDKFFSFKAEADGTYWFSMVIVYKNGTRDPADLAKTPAALKLLIDTTRPAVSVTKVERVGGDVTVLWDVVEKNPDWKTFRLEYKVGEGAWTPVAVTPEANGAAKIGGVPAGPVAVRVAVADLAGNAGEDSRSAAQLVPAGGVRTAEKVDPKPPVEPVLPGPPAPPSLGGDKFVPLQIDGPPVGPPPATSDFAPIRDPIKPVERPLPPPTEAPTQYRVASSNLPAAQVINITRFKMAVQLEDVGSSGVKKADVYVTRDDGQTWTKWSTHDKAESPLTVELQTRTNPTLEGIYGFKVVVESGAGLSSGARCPATPPTCGWTWT